MTYFPMFLRLTIASLLLMGHGIPKASLILFDYPLWGPHMQPFPLSFGKCLGATIEVFGPLMMLTGFYHRTGACMVAALMIGAAWPLPFFHVRILDLPIDYPVAIVPSKELQIYITMVFLASAVLGKGPIINKNNR